MVNTRTALRLLCIGLLLPAIGCVMPDQLSTMQKDINDIRQQLRRVQTDQQRAIDAVAALEAAAADSRGAVGREEMADLITRVEQIARDTTIVEERMFDLDRRLETVSNNTQRALSESRRSGTRPLPVVTVDPSTGTRPPLTRGVIPDSDELYNTAYADFSKGNYSLAIDGFEEYQRRFGDDARADNALYWVGECHFSQGHFDQAILAFDRLLELYSDSDKAPAGNLKKGLAYLEQNQVGQSIVQLRYVLSEFPGSDEARVAGDKLTSLGAAP